MQTVIIQVGENITSKAWTFKSTPTRNERMCTSHYAMV